MNKDIDPRPAMETLRQRAEASVEEEPTADRSERGDLSTKDAHRLIHELEVHRIELEMQNEELRKTQDALEETLDKYTNLFEYAPIGYFTVEKFGTINDANLRAGVLLRENRENLIDSPMPAFIARDDQDRFHKLRRSAIKNAGVHGCEMQMRRKDGTTFHARMDCTAIPGEDNAPALRISFSDITTLKELEQALQEREAWTQAVLDAADSGIIAINEQGVIKSVNPAAMQMFGYGPDELPGMKIKMLMPEPYRWRHEAGFKRYIESRRLVNIKIPRELEGLRKDGSLFPMELTLREISVATGRTIIGFIQDATERKQIERARKSFVAIASHELRTPATNISLALDMLAREEAGELPGRVKELVDIAHRGSKRLKRMISEMLDFHRFDLGELVFQTELLEIMDQVDEAIESNRAAAEQFEVKLNLGSRLQGAQVRADSDRLLQVLNNLLSNAMRFSPADGTVKVDVWRKDGYVRVAITDQGPGVPKELRSQLFEPFVQAEHSLEDSRHKESLGLGLVICKAIIEKLNGRIGFHSEPHIATRFWVELPESQIE